MSSLDRLRQRLDTVQDLRMARAVLEWDQETYMPAGGAEARAQQTATLARLAHELFTADEVRELLDAAEPEVEEEPYDAFGRSLVRVARRDYDLAARIPAVLVAELAQAISLAKEAWQAARAESNFARFAPHLERVVALTIRRAEALGYTERRYDALLDEYEPDMRAAVLDDVFAELRRELVPLVERLRGEPPPDDAFLHLTYDRDAQWSFGLEVIRAFGFDFERGRQDVSAHPFTTNFSTHDVRLTTRVNERFLPSALFGTLHECGHGLYEQNVDPALEGTLLAAGTSLGVHESQSMLWENVVGRSRPFWRHYFPRLRSRFPEQLRGVDLDRFYRAVNAVRPSLIRVEADEVTYNLHIMLRYELESALVEERLSVRELPEAWNARMEEYLGIRPPTDALGVLQDVHWSHGLIGYFPTYALGKLMASQLFDQIRLDLPDLDDRIAAGSFGELLDWLRRHVHRHGRKLTATELLRRATGHPLHAEPWLRYIRQKYGEVYGVEEWRRG